jgi:hypothetical protein
MRIRLTCLCLFLIITGYSQTLVPLERIRNLYSEKYISRDVKAPHTDIKPLIEEDLRPYIKIDSALTTGCYQSGKGRSWFIRKVYFEHFLKADTADFHIAADPLFDFQYGYDLADKTSLYRNSRGIQITGGVNDKLSFYTSYLETQARFPGYINKYVNYYEVVPGTCIVKEFKGNAWDYGLATGSVSYTPFKYLNVQLGYGKNSFGTGYRSLLLSDNSFQYPYLKLTARYGRFEYVSMFTSFTNLKTDSVLSTPYIWYAGYQKKGGTFNYLSVNITKWLQMGLFEGIIWKSQGLKDKNFNINQFIPVILVNTIRYGLFDVNNAVLGLNANVRPHKNLQLYGQFVLDDLHFNKPDGVGYQKTKYGFQAGAKWFDVLGLKNLILQAEYNQVRPYTYGHYIPLQSYTHYNQALAHPLGANFREVLGFIDYRYRRLYTEVQVVYANYGADTNGSDWGGNIFYTDTKGENGYNSVGNTTGQGLSTKIINAGIKIGYIFNPKYHLCFEGGYSMRNLSNLLTSAKSSYIWFCLRTNLFNQYFDF